MSFLIRNFHPRQIFHTYRILCTTQARQAHWLPDYMPGPYPKTKEEMEAAAKKYNLLLEEYEPYPEDEEPIGDYPKLPFESVDSKDPDYPWDDPELRKNYSEPVSREIIILLPHGISTIPKPFTKHQELYFFLRAISITFLILYLIYKIKLVSPCLEKQFPTPGVTHYTFDFGTEDPEILRKKKLEECLKKAGCSNLSEAEL